MSPQTPRFGRYGLEENDIEFSLDTGSPTLYTTGMIHTIPSKLLGRAKQMVALDTDTILKHSHALRNHPFVTSVYSLPPEMVDDQIRPGPTIRDTIGRRSVWLTDWKILPEWQVSFVEGQDMYHRWQDYKLPFFTNDFVVVVRDAPGACGVCGGTDWARMYHVVTWREDRTPIHSNHPQNLSDREIIKQEPVDFVACKFCGKTLHHQNLPEEMVP
jgi:hypothetical protein